MINPTMATYPNSNHAYPHGLSHEDQLNQQTGHGPGSASSGKSPVGGHFELFKNLTTEKKQTKDGQPPKRRGPKPDSKPALTRRQELNRQAQRTHRERKEQYIKALEQEVLRLKEIYSQSSREKDAVLEENRRLRQLLAQNGISYDFGTSPIKFQREISTYGPSSSGGSVISGSYAGTSEAEMNSPGSISAAQAQNMAAMQTNGMRNMSQLPANNGIDYDQVGIDFVLTLERPCMDHMQYLMVRSHNPEGQFFHHPMENSDDSEHDHMSGHALMHTGPSYSHIMTKPAEMHAPSLPADLDSSSLIKLLDLSARLPLDREGEITPVMAWSLIYGNQRVADLAAPDFERIKQNLVGKVRCYGFGAVLEEFEVRDALDTMLAEKDVVPALESTTVAAPPPQQQRVSVC